MKQDDHDKVPTYSRSAEQSVLGGLLQNNALWDDVADRLQKQDFHAKEHQIIFEAFADLVIEDKPFDCLTVKEHLLKQGVLGDMGGEAYLYDLVNNTPSISNLVAYADIIRERSVSRQLVEVVQEIGDSVWRPDGRSVHDLLDWAERKILAIGEQNQKTAGPVHIQELVNQTVDRIDELSKLDDPITGASTGFADFDDMTSGLQPSELIIIAGRPSMGKTILAVNMAQAVAIGSPSRSSQPVLVFSMEMPGEAIAMRMISSLGQIDQHHLRTGRIGDGDWSSISSAIDLLNRAPIFVDDSASLSPQEVRARARRMVKEHGSLGLVVVDYLQLMRVPGYRPENRTGEISEISRSLKALAKEIHCPVLALSQLNRSLEQRTDKRPVMSDLRESGAIEQDADLIAFIYRDEVYHEDSPDKGMAEVIIAKQRNGPIGKVRLTFQGKYTRFVGYSYQDYGDESLMLA